MEKEGSTWSWLPRKQPHKRGSFKSSEELGFHVAELVREANILGVI